MIRQITGTVAYVAEHYIVIDVHGVGYQLHTSIGPKLTLDQTVTLHTYLAVRENALELYGFQSLDELELFMLLLELPKIGPKSAAQIMAQADVDLLRLSVLSDDPVHLSKLSGIGAKTAEKIVQGLKDKFEHYAGAYEHAHDAAGSVHGTVTSDAIDALVALGYPQADARRTIHTVQKEHPTHSDANQLVKEALKMLNS